MQEINYAVTFIGNYPGGERYPLKVEAKATGVDRAIERATTIARTTRIDAANLTLISAVPESYPFSTNGENRDGLLKPCPFCGNPNVSLVEILRESDSENMHFVNCGCCNASQLPDIKEGAISHWNQRNEEVGQ